MSLEYYYFSEQISKIKSYLKMSKELNVYQIDLREI